MGLRILTEGSFRCDAGRSHGWEVVVAALSSPRWELLRWELLRWELPRESCLAWELGETLLDGPIARVRQS